MIMAATSASSASKPEPCAMCQANTCPRRSSRKNSCTVPSCRALRAGEDSASLGRAGRQGARRSLRSCSMLAARTASLEAGLRCWAARRSAAADPTGRMTAGPALQSGPGSTVVLGSFQPDGASAVCRRQSSRWGRSWPDRPAAAIALQSRPPMRARWYGGRACLGGALEAQRAWQERLPSRRVAWGSASYAIGIWRGGALSSDIAAEGDDTIDMAPIATRAVWRRRPACFCAAGTRGKLFGSSRRRARMTAASMARRREPAS